MVDQGNFGEVEIKKGDLRGLRGKYVSDVGERDALIRLRDDITQVVLPRTAVTSSLKSSRPMIKVNSFRPRHNFIPNCS